MARPSPTPVYDFLLQTKIENIDVNIVEQTFSVVAQFKVYFVNTGFGRTARLRHGGEVRSPDQWAGAGLFYTDGRINTSFEIDIVDGTSFPFYPAHPCTNLANLNSDGHRWEWVAYDRLTGCVGAQLRAELTLYANLDTRTFPYDRHLLPLVFEARKANGSYEWRAVNLREDASRQAEQGLFAMRDVGTSRMHQVPFARNSPKTMFKLYREGICPIVQVWRYPPGRSSLPPPAYRPPCPLWGVSQRAALDKDSDALRILPPVVVRKPEDHDAGTSRVFALCPRLCRHPGPWLRSILVPSFLLVLAVSTMEAFQKDVDESDRIGFVLESFLTSVALKIATGNTLPEKALTSGVEMFFLTVFMAHIVLIAKIVIWSEILADVNDEEDSMLVRAVFAVDLVFAGLWVMLTVGVLSYVGIGIRAGAVDGPLWREQVAQVRKVLHKNQEYLLSSGTL